MGCFVAAGYAPLYPERSLDDPALTAARKAIDLVLAGHEPYPALAIDVTLSELAVESFFPADQATAEALRAATQR
ncbi:hypothetical protein WMF42_20445 [Sorangium sp. So ce176]